MLDHIDNMTRLTKGGVAAVGSGPQPTSLSRSKTDPRQYSADRVPYARLARRSSQVNTEDLERDMRSP